MTPSFERAIYAFRRSTQYAPVWTAEATPLERVGIAQYAPDALEQYAPLTALEALVAATYNAKSDRKEFWLDTVHTQHPRLDAAYIDAMTVETDYEWRHSGRNTWSTPTQHLIAQYEAVRRRLDSLATETNTFAPPSAVMLQFSRTRPSLYQDSMLQRIIACNDNATFSTMIAEGKPLDPQAYAIAFLQTSTPTDKWYAHMDDEAFGGLVAHDPDAQYPSLMGSAQARNPALHRYPWEKMPVLLEHHPARFFASITTRQEMALNTAGVAQWFQPMLDAVSERIDKDPRYASVFTGMALSKSTSKTFTAMLHTYAPIEYEALQCIRQLDADADSPETLALWAQWLPRSKIPAMTLALPTLDM